ncbi:hypothetical protein [Tritonibacter mobilis]|uniref:hypothetical protein n=1 Tax=Tritonibacter mobilis TaxID=379347 RepID=UPI001CDA3B32|nr:hypothetical protein [Tritonibacter mobilis]MCA2008631.1 hypothetical protein [Tritonibacter mobilis]
MKKPDCRSKNDILRHQRCDLLIGDSNLAAATVQELRLVDDLLAYLETRGISSMEALSAQEFLNFDARNGSESLLRRLKQAIMAIFPGHPSVLAIEEAIRSRESKRNKQSNPKARRLTKSVEFNQLPLVWREAFADMDTGFDRNGELPPAEGMMTTHKMKMRQLLFSARAAGLPDALSTAAVRAYARDLRNRGVAPATLRSSFAAVQKFARYMAAETETLDLLADLVRIYEAEARKSKSKKFEHLQKTGYSPVALIEQAREILQGAEKHNCPRSRHAQRNRAGALALFSVMPVRLADTRFVIGENLFWTGSQYTVDTALSKSGYAWATDIDPRLNIFIDALILRGADPVWLDHMRETCLAEKRSLFIKNDGTPVAYGYVSDCWRREVGTGEHIARTVLHTFIGIEMGQAGTDMAMASCGQRNHATAEAYQGEALAMAQRMKGQAELREIANKGELEMFEFK